MPAGEADSGVVMTVKYVSAVACVVAVIAVMSFGCDDRAASRSARRGAASSPSAPNSAHPSDDAAQTAAATQPAGRSSDTQPASSFLTVDGRITKFPSARLRLTKTDDGVRALLFSDDPKEAISASYGGNSFYFDVPLKIAEPAEIAEADYSYRAPSSDSEEDSPNGIFLNGMRVHLQPQDIVITFDGDSPKVMAHVAGRFLVVNTTAQSAPGQFVPVTGTLFMTAEVKQD
jgi:hypothetical protein